MPNFTPAETASRSGFTIETLRYYENIGLLRDIKRNASGHRVFGKDDLDWLAALRCLRDTGMPIAAMLRYAEYVQANTAGDDSRSPGTSGSTRALGRGEHRPVAKTAAAPQGEDRLLPRTCLSARHRVSAGRVLPALPFGFCVAPTGFEPALPP
jgi:DNA-binding transcriptional MerR regulator